MNNRILILTLLFIFIASISGNAQVTAPTITSVTLSPSTGSSSAQPFYINGTNFLSGCSVTLRDLTTSQTFANMTIIAQTGTQIQLNIKFPKPMDKWSAEVINPGNSASGQYAFQLFVLGVDISHYQSDPPLAAIDWNKVKNSGIVFAFAKATQGTTYVDGFYQQYMTDGTKAGILMSGYHFADPTPTNAIDEAQHFLSVAGAFIKTGFLPPVLDLEDDPGNNSVPSNMGSSQLSSWVDTWMNTIYQKTGVEPILYTNNSYAKFLSSSINKYLLWIADPDNQPLSTGTTFGIWQNYTFKQFSWTANVPGIATEVDEDSFNGDSASLSSLIINNPLNIQFNNAISPSSFELSQNFPNPFNPTTTINYSVSKAGIIVINVYDLLGEKVKTLVNENKPAGNYSVKFNGALLPSGVYIYRLQADGFVKSKKLILVK